MVGFALAVNDPSLLKSEKNSPLSHVELPFKSENASSRDVNIASPISYTPLLLLSVKDSWPVDLANIRMIPLGLPLALLGFWLVQSTEQLPLVVEHDPLIDPRFVIKEILVPSGTGLLN